MYFVLNRSIKCPTVSTPPLIIVYIANKVQMNKYKNLLSLTWKGNILAPTMRGSKILPKAPGNVSNNKRNIIIGVCKV